MTQSKSRTEPVSRLASWADVVAEGGQRFFTIRINKLSFYARFGVHEVLIWKKGEISIHILKKDGSGYRKAKKSSRFPALDMALVERCTQREKSGLDVDEFRAALGE